MLSSHIIYGNHISSQKLINKGTQSGEKSTYKQWLSKLEGKRENDFHSRK